MRIAIALALVMVGALVSAAFVSRVHAQITNVRVSDEQYLSPEEVSIAINPLRPNELVAGANLNFVFTSSDAGWSWQTGFLYTDRGVYGDPCLLADSTGTFYYSHLTGVNHLTPDWLSSVTIQKSTDAGALWNSGAYPGSEGLTQQDKQWLTLDKSDTRLRNSIAMSWTRFDRYASTEPGDSSRIFFTRSTDRGDTWHEETRVDDTAGDCLDDDNTVEGALTAIHPDGTTFVAWAARGHIYLDASTDAGLTWGRDRIIAEQYGGWNFSVPGIYRANGLPQLFCDASASSFRGRLYLLWSDQLEGATNVYLSYSTDKGEHWSGRRRVNGGIATREHFFPSMCIDQVTGHLYVVYYDRRAYYATATDVYLAKSNDGGESFSELKISEQAFVPQSGVFFGDYIHIAAHDRHVYPIWMRLDSTILSVWTAPYLDTSAQLSAVTSMPTNDFTVGRNSSDRFPVSFSLAQPAQVEITITDITGRTITTLTNSHYGAGSYRLNWNASSVAHTTYLFHITVTAEGEVWERTEKAIRD